MRQIKVTIKPRENRIDKFLSSKIKDLTRSQAKKLIKRGLVKVDKRVVSPDFSLSKGDVVTIESTPPNPVELKPEKLPLNRLFEDDWLIIVDKESGMVVHPVSGHLGGTLVNALLYHWKNLPGFGKDLRPGIVHRLDKGTSGLLVVAKTNKALENLKLQFKNRKVTKKYLALVGGRVEPPVGKIEKPIGRHQTQRNKFTISPQGKEAVTYYKVLDYIGDRFSLVEIEPKTGRTHQIRVHFAQAGHPLVGDKLYGGRPAARLFLHSSFLEFAHPATGKKAHFESKLPGKLEEILGKIRKGVNSQ